MCFRNAQSAKLQKLAQKYGKLTNVIDMYKAVYDEKYHVSAFTNPRCPIITADPQIQLFRWGLIPNWLKESKTQQSRRQYFQQALSWRTKTYNARSETIFEKPSYRTPILRTRCLIPSTGYFEHHHETTATGKPLITPYFINLKDQDLFSIAGIYDRCQRCNFTNI